MIQFFLIEINNWACKNVKTTATDDSSRPQTK